MTQEKNESFSKEAFMHKWKRCSICNGSGWQVHMGVEIKADIFGGEQWVQKPTAIKCMCCGGIGGVFVFEPFKLSLDEEQF